MSSSTISGKGPCFSMMNPSLSFEEKVLNFKISIKNIDQSKEISLQYTSSQVYLYLYLNFLLFSSLNIFFMTNTPLFPKNQFLLPRGIIKNCELCNQEFGIFLREHLCKRCMRAICADCGIQHREVFKVGSTKRLHRICHSCIYHSDFIRGTIKIKNLSFGVTSSLAIFWLSNIKKSTVIGLSNPKQNLFKRQHLRELWDSFSFEFRQYVGILTFQYEDESIYQTINSVFRAITAIYPNQSINQLIYLIVFFLGFASIDNAIQLTLQMIRLKSQIQSLKHSIMVCLKQFPISKEMLFRFERYIDYRIQTQMNSFMINGVTMQALISIISEVIEKGSFEEMICFFCSHLFTNLALLDKIKENKVMSDAYMLRYCQIEEVYANYRYLKNRNFVVFREEGSRTKSELIQTDYFREFQQQREVQISVISDKVSKQVQAYHTKDHQKSIEQRTTLQNQSIESLSSSLVKDQNSEKRQFQGVDVLPPQLKMQREGNENQRESIEQLKKTISVKDAEIFELKKTISSNQSQMSRFYSSMTVLKSQIAQYQNKIDRLKTQYQCQLSYSSRQKNRNNEKSEINTRQTQTQFVDLYASNLFVAKEKQTQTDQNNQLLIQNQATQTLDFKDEEFSPLKLDLQNKIEQLLTSISRQKEQKARLLMQAKEKELEKDQIFIKFTDLLMKFEEEKLALSDQVFELKRILKEHHIILVQQ